MVKGQNSIPLPPIIAPNNSDATMFHEDQLDQGMKIKKNIQEMYEILKKCMNLKIKVDFLKYIHKVFLEFDF